MEHRRLAAIMFTDLVGYSALVQKNETTALHLLEQHNSLLRSVFAQFNGNEIKTIGDAFLVEFSSTLDAVRCAISIQQSVFERNKTLPPAERFQVRIGLHVGDVVLQKGDVLGDGVNIASRIEPLAAPGGICLSEDVARQVMNKIDVPLTRLGRGDLKNIRTPVQIFRVDLPWEKSSGMVAGWMRFIRGRRAPMALGATLLLSAILYFSLSTPGGGTENLKRRIAVLPLANIGSNDQEDYFSEGMTEEFISSLSRIRDISVIARSSILKYRGADLDITKVGNELGVGTILGGSIRRSADRVRVSIRLIDVASQGVLWSDDYEREVRDVFAIQSDIAMRVASELKIQLLEADQQRLERKGSEIPEAHRAYLLGRFHLNKRTNDDNTRAIDYFNEAVSLDPSYALAYVGLAEAYTLIGGAGYTGASRNEAVQRATAAATRALELDDRLAEAHTILGYVKFRLEWNWMEAEREFKMAIDLQPGYAKVYEWYALYLTLIGKPDNGIEMMKRALELDPLSLSVNTGLARFLSYNGDQEASIRQFQKVFELDPNYAEAHFGIGLTYCYSGEYQKGIDEVRKAIELSGRRHVMLSNLGYLYARFGQRDSAIALLKEFDKINISTHVSPYHYAIIYAGLGETDKAFVELEKAYEEHEGLMVYMKTDDLLGDLQKDPRYETLLRKIGFPE